MANELLEPTSPNRLSPALPLGTSIFVAKLFLGNSRYESYGSTAAEAENAMRLGWDESAGDTRAPNATGLARHQCAGAPCFDETTVQNSKVSAYVRIVEVQLGQAYLHGCQRGPNVRDILDSQTFAAEAEGSMDAKDIEIAQLRKKLQAADAMAKICDDWVVRGEIDARSALADARLIYGNPFKYAFSDEQSSDALPRT